jgi:hypothetical protein
MIPRYYAVVRVRTHYLEWVVYRIHDDRPVQYFRTPVRLRCPWVIRVLTWVGLLDPHHTPYPSAVGSRLAVRARVETTGAHP